MTDFQIATFNVHHGRNQSQLFSREKLLSAVKKLNVDILCLQEIDMHSLRTFFVNQPALIANHLNYGYRTTQVRFFGAGFQHNSIISRFPIIAHEEKSLPSRRGHQNRKSLTARIELDSHIFSVTTAHLHSQGNDDGPNVVAEKQLEHCLENLAQNDISIVGADMNMEEQVPTIAHKFGYVSPGGQKTSPALSPQRQIDWILARGCDMSNTHASEELIGDHRALISTVTLL